MDIRKISAILHEIVHEWRIIGTEDIPFRQYVVDACKQNRCGMYGKTWQCPPGIGTMEALQKKCLSYQNALVFTTCHKLEDSFDIEGMSRAREKHEGKTDAVIGLFEGIDIRALSAEGCGLCTQCTYPHSPCRYPQKARPSVESNGISVVELAQYCKIRYNNGPNTVTYFSVILY